MKRLLVAVSIFVLSISFTGNSVAATVSGNIYVEVDASVICVMGNVAMSLGTYSGSTINQTTSFDVQCSATTPYTISYGEGSHFLGGQRRMSDGGTNYLDYRLSCESTSGSGIDQECGNDSTIGRTSSGTGTGLVQPFAVEAGVFPGQFVPAGRYWDDVQTTLTY